LTWIPSSRRWFTKAEIRVVSSGEINANFTGEMLRLNARDITLWCSFDLFDRFWSITDFKNESCVRDEKNMLISLRVSSMAVDPSEL
jgi:hypothetical protein